MDTLGIVEIKDFILKYISEHNQRSETLETIFKELNQENLSIVIFKDYATEMKDDGVIKITHISGDRNLAVLTREGRALLLEGGYVERLEKEIEEKQKQVVDAQTSQAKKDLEIKNLHASLKNYGDIKNHNKCTRVIAIIALIISGLTFLFLVTKEIILKFIFPPN